MIEHRLWLPVCAAADLAAGAVVAIRVLGRDIALWRTAEGHLAAAPDRCPHRGTPLSLGCVQGESLVCAYHGWHFGPTGRCVRIPALPALRPGTRQALATVDVGERHGMIWVRLGPAHEADLLAQPPAFEGPDGPGISRLLCGPYDVATSAPRVVENFLDLAHFGFVHPGTLGDPAQPQIPDYQVAGGLATQGLQAEGCQAWQPRSNLLAESGAMVRYRYSVPAPFGAVLAKCPEGWDSHEESIALFTLPMEPARTRVWFLVAMSAAGRSDAQIRAFQDAIFEQDRRILEAQRPACLPLDPALEVSCAADRLSLAYRLYLRTLGIGFGVEPVRI